MVKKNWEHLQLTKRSIYSASQVRQLLLESNEKDDILDSYFAESDDEFESEHSDNETDKVPRGPNGSGNFQFQSSWSVGNRSTSSVVHSEFKPLKNVGPKSIPIFIT